MNEYVSRFERWDRVRSVLPPILIALVVVTYLSCFFSAQREQGRETAKRDESCRGRGGIPVDTLCVNPSALR